MKRIPISSRSFQKGVVIIEVMVAILLFSVGVLAIAGLQATMLQDTTESKYRAEASYVAHQLIGSMWSNPVATNAGAFNTVKSVPELPNGQVSVTRAIVGGPFTITVTWQLPGQDPHKLVTTATVTPL